MRSVREVTKAYNEMLKMMENKPEHDPKINVYSCPNGHHTITKDVDKGVTPFMHLCATCKEMAHSSFYKCDQTLEPVEEWYRPSLEETLKLRKKQGGMLDHILQGGLDVRTIKKD